jgi:hypothetical protein
MFENRVRRYLDPADVLEYGGKIFGPKMDEVAGKCTKKQTTRSFMISILHQNHSGDQIKKNEMGGLGGTYDGTEVHT